MSSRRSPPRPVEPAAGSRGRTRWSRPEIGPARPIRRLLPSVRNMAAGYAGHACEAAAFLLLTPFLVRGLGLAEFGLWSVVVALAEWLGLLDLGLKEAVMKFAAAHQARADTRAVRRVGDTALVLYMAAGLLALAVGLVLAWLALPHMVQSSADLGRARLVLILLVTSSAISLPAGLSGTLLEGLSRFDLLNLFRIMHAALRLGLIVVALQLQLGLLGVALAELTARIVLHTARWYSVWRIQAVLVPWPWLHRDALQEMVTFGVWNALRQAGEVALSKLYEPVLSLLAGMPAVGAFYVGRRLGSMPAELMVPMAGVLFPLSSELEAAGRGRTLRDTYLNATKIALVVGLPLALVLAFGADPILTNWLQGRAPEAAPVLMVFAFVFLAMGAALPSEVMLLGLGHARLLAILGLAQGIITLGAGIPLVSRMGPAGLAVGALLAVTLVQGLVQMPMASRQCGLPLRTLLRRGILPPLLAALPVAVVMGLLQDRIAVGGLAALATWAGGTIASYAALLWLFCFEPEEKAFLRSHVRRLFVPPSRIDDWEDLP